MERSLKYGGSEKTSVRKKINIKKVTGGWKNNVKPERCREGREKGDWHGGTVLGVRQRGRRERRGGSQRDETRSKGGEKDEAEKSELERREALEEDEKINKTTRKC